MKRDKIRRSKADTKKNLKSGALQLTPIDQLQYEKALLNLIKTVSEKRRSKADTRKISYIWRITGYSNRLQHERALI